MCIGLNCEPWIRGGGGGGRREKNRERKKERGIGIYKFYLCIYSSRPTLLWYGVRK